MNDVFKIATGVALGVYGPTLIAAISTAGVSGARALWARIRKDSAGGVKPPKAAKAAA